jgi:putative toxin-antitoxin system antitoxin component (TIGR02293 family)
LLDRVDEIVYFPDEIVMQEAEALELPAETLASERLQDQIALDRLQRDGLPLATVDALAAAGLVDLDHAIELDVISRTSWASARKSGSGRLSPAMSEKILRLARIQARAADTFGRDKARLWLLRPCEPLDNRPPLALLASESGARAVETLLGRIDHGIAA